MRNSEKTPHRGKPSAEDAEGGTHSGIVERVVQPRVIVDGGGVVGQILQQRVKQALRKFLAAASVSRFAPV